MLVWLSGGFLPIEAAPTQAVGVHAYILNPPNTITDFSASGVGLTDGDIQLAWKAPRNINGARVSHYLIRYATYPASSALAAETWWSDNAATQQTLSPAQAPDVQEFKIYSGFSVGTKYYFGIKSVDVDGQISSIDSRVGLSNQAQAFPLYVITGPPATPTNFIGTALSTTSIRWSWDADFVATNYTLYNYPSDSFVTQTTTTFINETGLTPNSSLSRRLRAGNALGLSAPTAAQTIYTLANIPIGVAITHVGFTDLTLAWSNNSNTAGTQYRIERSLDGVSYVPHTIVTATAYSDTSLNELTSYYYRIRAINGDGIQTSPSIVVSTFTPLQVDFIAPRQPMGLKGVLDPSHTAFTLIWENVMINTDGTTTTDLVGYNVYRSSSLAGTRTKLTSTPITSTAYADTVNGQVYYYVVKSIDTSGNESEASLFADSSASTNIIYLGPDGQSFLKIPDSVNDLLRSEYNKYAIPLSIVMTEEPVPSATSIVRNIKLLLLRGDTGEVIQDLSFTQPDATVAVGYNVVAGQVATGAPGTSGAPTLASVPEKDLSLFWNNGVSWIKVGGVVDTVNNAVKTRSAYLGNYQLRASASATSLKLDQANVYPRVFTPNGDGFNDLAYFVLENPNNASVTGDLYDLKGRHIATLLPTTGAGIGTTLTWDGKDSTGSLVPSGAYIYKIKGEGKTFTGSVGVAR